MRWKLLFAAMAFGLGTTLTWPGAAAETRLILAPQLLRSLSYRTALQLPFPPGQAWEVIQGNNDATGSHKGYAAYCWDFMLAKEPSDQSKSKGVVFYASAPGRVVWVEEGNPSGGAGANMIVVRQAEGEYASYMHLLPGTFTKTFKNGAYAKGMMFLPQAMPWDSRPMVLAGEALAQTGDVGANAGAYHVHIALTTRPDVPQFKPLTTIPAAFANYYVSKDRGKTWAFVKQGIPKKGEWVKRETAAPPSGGTVEAPGAATAATVGTIQGTVSLGSGKPTGNGKLLVSVGAPWGEALRSQTIAVTMGQNDGGPWTYKLENVASGDKLSVSASFQGPWSVPTGGGPVSASMAGILLKKGETKTVNLTLKATVIR